MSFVVALTVRVCVSVHCVVHMMNVRKNEIPVWLRVDFIIASFSEQTYEILPQWLRFWSVTTTTAVTVTVAHCVCNK